MSPDDYIELTNRVDRLIEGFATECGMPKSEVARAVKSYVDDDLVDNHQAEEELEEAVAEEERRIERGQADWAEGRR